MTLRCPSGLDRVARAVVAGLGITLLVATAGCVTTETVAAPLPSVRATPPPPAVPAPAATATPTDGATPEQPPTAEPDPLLLAEEQVLALANQARADAGLVPLERSAEMDTVSRAWSAHLATEGLDLAHNPDFAELIPGGWSQAAENVGWMSPSGATYDEVAATIHQSWMESEGHRHNLLNPAFTHIGIGVVSSPEHGWYLTQNFAAY
jgi:uncharacterized protein YkwD